MERIVLHIDLDYFYAQIEEIHDQSIQNKSNQLAIGGLQTCI